MKKKYKIILIVSIIIFIIILLITTFLILFHFLWESMSFYMDVFDFEKDYIVKNEYFEAYYDSHTNKGFTIPITFKSTSNEIITIESIECNQIYKNKNISDDYEVSLSSDDNKNLPLILYPQNHLKNNLFYEISFDTKNEFHDNIQIGDKVYVEISMIYKIDKKEYKITKKFIKTYLRKKFYNLP